MTRAGKLTNQCSVSVFTSSTSPSLGLSVSSVGTLYAATLSTVYTVSTAASGTSYLIHGSMDATIPSTQGGATVKLHATF